MTAISRLLALALLAVPTAAMSQSVTEAASGLSIELNAAQEVQGACRFTFVAQNDTGSEIDKAVFETVIFDLAGTVVRLSLFDFRDLPQGRPRVRQFDVPGMSCAAISQTLINGTSSCIVQGAESGVCGDGLSLTSRISMKLLG